MKIFIALLALVAASAANNYAPLGLYRTCPDQIEYVTDLDWDGIQGNWVVQKISLNITVYKGCYSAFWSNIFVDDLLDDNLNVGACINQLPNEKLQCGFEVGSGTLTNDTAGQFTYSPGSPLEAYFIDADKNNYMIGYACQRNIRLIYALTRNPNPPALFFSEFNDLLIKYGLTDVPVYTPVNEGCSWAFPCKTAETGWNGTIAVLHR